MNFDVITKHFRSGQARAPEDEIHAILSSRYRALFGAAGVVAYTGYTLATRGRAGVSLGGLVRTTAVISIAPPWIASNFEASWRCSGLDPQESQSLLSRLQKDPAMTLPGPFTNCGMLAGFLACLMLFKKRSVPLLIDGLVDPEKFVRSHSQLRRTIYKGADWVFVPIAFGGLGALVYYTKRGVDSVLSRADPAPDTAVLRSKLQKRLVAAKERVQDGLSVPLKLRWLRDYAMIQAGAGLKLGLSYSWFSIPMTIIFMRGTPGTERVLIRNCVRNAGLLGAFVGISLLPAIHSLLVLDIDGRAKQYRKELKSAFSFDRLDRYIATGAALGGSLLPLLTVKGAPKAYLVDFVSNGKFVYSFRNMGILGVGGLIVGAGLGSHISMVANLKST
ncbi:hypothetical protein K523DRAFT_313780 [Schizophyllum commune Tattone D]|nr:hypothetical protein K523DRAFT_313780 [Schizophyllum commune Tattone D]